MTIDYTAGGGPLGDVTVVYQPTDTNHATILQLGTTGQATTESGSGGVPLSDLAVVGGDYEIGLIVNQSNSTIDPILLTSLTFTVGATSYVVPVDGGVLLSDNPNGAGTPDYALLIPTDLFPNAGGADTFTITATIQDAVGGPERFITLTPTFVANPEISVTKDTFENGVNVDNGHVLSGQAIEWDYSVTNTGNTVLGAPALSDDNGGGTAFAPAPVLGNDGYNVGDVADKGFLDPGETWQYTATGTAGSTAYTNTVTATDGAAPQVQAQSSYTGVTPGITVDKQVSGDGTNYVDTTVGTPLVVLAGKTIYFQANVTNTTTGGLSETNVGVTDNPALSFTNGGNSTLTLPYNSEASFTASTTVLAGAHSDTATASGTVTDDGGKTANPSAQSSAYYYGATAGITVDKQMSLDGSTGWTDTTGAAPLVVLAGKTLHYQAIVTNTTDGGLGATGVHVDDSAGGPTFSGGATTLGGTLATDSTTYTASGATLAGLHGDTVTAGESATDGVNSTDVTATSSAYYYGATAGITVDKQVSGAQGASKTWADTGVSATPTAAVILAAVTQNGATNSLGNKVYYQAVVTNTTDGGLGAANVSVLDNTSLAFSGGSTTLGGTLATDFTTFTANATATTGAHADTVTASEDATDGVNSTHVSAQDSAAYNGATAAISVVKQVSLDGVHWFNEGVGAPVVTVGQSVEFRVQVTNTSTYGLTATGVSVTDTGSYNGSFNFGAGHTSTVTLAAGASTYSNAVIVTALAGVNTDTANASGTVQDSFGNSATPTATDSASYFGFKEGVAGLSQGYWYNHTTQTKADPNHHWAAEVYVAGEGWGVLLGDPTGAAAGTTVTAASILANHELFVQDAAAYALINASTSANDTRQTLMSQALAAQLNIDNHDTDPGVGTSGDLIQEAVQWLEGSAAPWGGPFTGFSDNSSGNVDKNHDGIVDGIDFTKGAFTFEGADGHQIANKALVSSAMAWQTFEPFTTPGTFVSPSGVQAGGSDGQVLADGEGLKNALMAFNQNQLVTDSSGHYVAWDASGSTSGPFTYVIANGSNDFWAVLAAASGLHGIV